MSVQLPLTLTTGGPLEGEPFVVHAGVEDAVRTLDAWPNWPGGALALVGRQGSGKSHLAAIWAARTNARRFVDDAPDASTQNDRPMLIEDADRSPAGERLFHLFNAAALGGATLLLTARTLPRVWTAEVPDLRSRLNALAVAELEPPDEAGVLALLQQTFQRRGLMPSQELLTYLARRVERSADGVRSVVERLDALALATHRPVSRAVARELLGREPDLFEED